jgi:hypothetical protein
MLLSILDVSACYRSHIISEFQQGRENSGQLQGNINKINFKTKNATE